MSDDNITQPMPKKNFNVSYICRYESEIDRQIIFDSMSHYIEEVLGYEEGSLLNGTETCMFVKIPMEAVNKVFHIDENYPGEEIEFAVDHRHNNVTRNSVLVNDELPPLWSVLVKDESNVKLITTIEPCKFIIRTSDLSELSEILKGIEIAPKEYNLDALEIVHWNEKTKVAKQDFEFFIASRKWFKKKKLPYNRSYMLYGPPGNGKTTTIKSFARCLNVSPETFDFTAQHNAPDKAFTQWILGDSQRIARNELEENTARKYNDDENDEDDDRPIPIRLLILEDIDRYYPKDGPPQTAVSLSCVLGSLDGVIERRNTIIIATANHPENLDRKVLTRPGRFDKQIEYEHPNSEHAFSYLKGLFHDEDVTDKTLKEAVKQLQGQSYAFHKELFTSAGSYAFVRNLQLNADQPTINDEDVMNGLNDLLKSAPANVMKSEKKSFGFD